MHLTKEEVDQLAQLGELGHDATGLFPSPVKHVERISPAKARRQAIKSYLVS